MRLEEHIADTLKEWELKLGKIDGGIRLYYPCDSIREYLGQAYTCLLYTSYSSKDGVFDDYSPKEKVAWWTNGFWGGIMWQM